MPELEPELETDDCPECGEETSIGMNGSTAATPAKACGECGWYEWV